MSKQEMNKGRSTGALLEMISNCLACQFLSDLHSKNYQALAYQMMKQEQEPLCTLYGEQSYREALAYVERGKDPAREKKRRIIDEFKNK